MLIRKNSALKSIALYETPGESDDFWMAYVQIAYRGNVYDRLVTVPHEIRIRSGSEAVTEIIRGQAKRMFNRGLFLYVRRFCHMIRKSNPEVA